MTHTPVANPTQRSASTPIPTQGTTASTASGNAVADALLVCPECHNPKTTRQTLCVRCTTRLRVQRHRQSPHEKIRHAQTLNETTFLQCEERKRLRREAKLQRRIAQQDYTAASGALKKDTSGQRRILKATLKSDKEQLADDLNHLIAESDARLAARSVDESPNAIAATDKQDGHTLTARAAAIHRSKPIGDVQRYFATELSK